MHLGHPAFWGICGFCALVLVALPYLFTPRPVRQASPDAAAPAATGSAASAPSRPQSALPPSQLQDAPSQSFGAPQLMLSEASFVSQGNSKRLVGIVQNASPRAYTQVQLRFDLSSAQDSLGTVVVSVKEIGARGNAHFESGPVPLQATHFYLAGTEGTPR